MAKSKINRLQDGTIKIEFSLPWSEVKKEYAQALEIISQNIEIKGFRKGKAPKKTVEEKVGKEAIYQRVIKTLVPQAYAEIIRQNNLKPIINPQVKAVTLPENKDWQFEAQTCEAPELKLGQYQEAVTKINAKEKIWTPDKGETTSKDYQAKTQSGQATNQRLSQIFDTLLTKITITIPQILLKSEADRLLVNLLDEIKKLGLTLDTYLSSKNLTPEQLRSQYEKIATENLKLEFILSAIADDLKIQVKPEEIEKILKQAESKEEKKQLEAQKYYLASVLRRRKTIDKLLAL